MALAVFLLDAEPFRRGLGTLTGRHDNATFNFPLRVEVARQWREGRLPLWNPYQLAGFPLLADITTGVLYPGNLPFLLDPDAKRHRALDQVASLHFVLAAIFMFVFARSLALGRAAAALSGLVYAGNGFLLLLASRWIQAQSSAVWLPLILASVVRAAEPRGFWLWSAIGAAAVALQTLSGYPQYGFYTGLMAGALALVLAIGGGRERWRPIAALLLIYGLGIALSAVQLLPTLEIVAQSRRGGPVSLSGFLAMSTAPNALLGMLIPRAAATVSAPYFVMGGAFVGTLAVVLAIEGARSRRRHQLFLTVTLVVTMLLALGSFTPLGALVHHVPGLNAFRYPFKHLLEVVFCVAVLAGFGTQAVLDGRRGARTCVATGAVLAIYLTWRFTGVTWHWAQLWTVVGSALFAVLVLLGQRRAAIGAAIGFVWLGLAGNRDALFVWSDRRVPDPPEIVQTLVPRVQSILGPRYVAGLWALDARAGVHTILGLDYPSEFRVPSVHGTSPFSWTPLREALHATDDGAFTKPRVLVHDSHQTLDVLAVGYAGSPRRPLPGKVIRDDAGAYVVVRPHALPPVRFVDQVICMKPPRIARQHEHRKLSFATVALIECEGKPELPAIGPTMQDAEIALVTAEPGFLRIRAEQRGRQAGMLIVSQSDMPGWRARIDGEDVPIYRAYGLVQGIVVPPGLHDVELEYLPQSLLDGGLISLAGLVGWIGIGALAWRERRGSRPDERSGASTL